MEITRVAVIFKSLIFLLIIVLGNALSLNHYEQTCPIAELTVAKVVKEATAKDKTVPATLLRMHFHDCFLRGCDASILLNSKVKKAEKDAPPNASLHAFYVIDEAKKEVEAMCPGVVSCADILAFAARDSVVLSGGPYWDVPKGRKDGRISRASETAKLPSPAFNVSQLEHHFSLRGLNTDDIVALLGAHTLGFAHCSSFSNRIHNFNATHDVDPTMRPSFAARLKSICPANKKLKNAGASMDPSSSGTFDNNYYKLIIQRNSLFYSDQALLTTQRTKDLVYKFATSKHTFRRDFVKSITKMSSITGGQEIRRDCRMAN
ncbi:unnamed protein product [Rhodiola kirilowii]